MATTVIASGSKLATGINVFTTPPERQQALIETLSAINHEIITHKFPMNISANFHRATDAPIVINYNQYTDRSLGQYLRTRPETAPLMKRTHELSEKHEIRWYEIADVIATEGPGDRIEISAERGNLAVLGIFTVEPGKQGTLLDLLRGYGEGLKAARVPGFIGIATHRGYQADHVSSYEQWASADAYRQAIAGGPAADTLKQIRETASVTELHQYDVLSVTRFDLAS